MNFSIPDDIREAFNLIIKWLFQNPERETDTEQATCLITADGRYHRKAEALPGVRHLRDWHG